MSMYEISLPEGWDSDCEDNDPVGNYIRNPCVKCGKVHTARFPEKKMGLLNGIKEVIGTTVEHWPEGRTFDSEPAVIINDTTDTICFRMLSDINVQGCSVDALIAAAKSILEIINNSSPCIENATAIIKLEAVLDILDKKRDEQ